MISAKKGNNNPSDEEIRLPSDSCAFEFAFSEAYFIYWIVDELHILFAEMNSIGEGWGAMLLQNPSLLEASKLEGFKTLWHAIKAICVALDAEVAEEEIIRVSFARKSRIKKGQAPMRDYHIVNLAKRHRIANPHGGHSGIKHRLHFRRGHWRHYEDHKTWIKWCLAGDAELGFIDKHYTV